MDIKVERFQLNIIKSTMQWDNDHQIIRQFYFIKDNYFMRQTTKIFLQLFLNCYCDQKKVHDSFNATQ